MKKKLIVISSLLALTLASTIMLSNVDTLLTKADPEGIKYTLHMGYDYVVDGEYGQWDKYMNFDLGKENPETGTYFSIRNGHVVADEVLKDTNEQFIFLANTKYGGNSVNLTIPITVFSPKSEPFVSISGKFAKDGGELGDFEEINYRNGSYRSDGFYDFIISSEKEFSTMYLFDVSVTYYC